MGSEMCIRDSYRNHGSAFGRVLCGLQVPPEESEECRKALDGVGYEYSDETDNPAYRMFLGTGID